jgi:hypothetical protein
MAERAASPGAVRFLARFSQQGLAMVGFPLLLIPLAIYNIIVFLMPGVSFTDPLVKLTLMSGAEWPLTLSDVLLALGILLLMCEVIKGARPGAKYLTDHLLSLIVSGAAAAEFVLWSKFGTSTYFLLVALSMVDFLSGLALRTRRGAAAAMAPAISRKSARAAAEPPVEEPLSHPAPAPSAPAANPAAESLAQDHHEPTFAPPSVAPDPASPEVPSPGLQPGNSVPPPDTPQR